MLQTIILAAVGYLIGAVSFARIVGAIVLPGTSLERTDMVLPGDNRSIEYTGVSATSVGARLGSRWGMVVGVLDMLKGYVPVLATQLIWPGSSDHLVVAAAIIVGHNWPVFYGFKGGRGQSAVIGSLLAIDWLAPLVCIPLGAAIGLLVFRDMFIAYYLGQPLLIVWFAAFGRWPEAVYCLVWVVAMVIASWPEMSEYFRRRRTGEINRMASWRELLKAHPAMGSSRYTKPPKPPS
jgi:acyl phosphate:glycerol-3-phosphate acyltransferase